MLLGHRTGDNNQLLRLAGELNLPFRALRLSYNPLHLLPPAVLRSSVASLTGESRALLGPPWPDLVLGIGHRSVPAALAIRQRSGGRAKLVRLGNPRLSPACFDLVITTAQYDVPAAPNVLRLALGLNTVPPLEPNREERAWLRKLPPPHRLLLIGGDTFMWTLDPPAIAKAAAAIADKPGGSTIAVASARTGAKVMAAVSQALKASEHAIVSGGFPRYPVLLADADEIYVTVDSVAMMSDAVASAKPVGLIEPRMTAIGRAFHAREKLGGSVPVRNIRRVWTWVLDQGLAGSVEQPRSGRLDPDPLKLAVTAIRRLLER